MWENGIAAIALPAALAENQLAVSRYFDVAEE